MKKTLFVILPSILMMLVPGCRETILESSYNGFGSIISYKDIPGVTEDEINAIEALKEKVAARGQPLVVGNSHNTESFITIDGTIGGFIPLFCEWLTDLFGIPFAPEIHELNEMISGLLTGDIDFGTNTYTEERQQIFYMTEPISYRSLKIMRKQNSYSPYEIERMRPVRYVFLQEGTHFDVASELLTPGSYEPLFANTYDEMYYLLASGEADAMILYNSAEAVFDIYDDVIVEDFLPLSVVPTTLSTGVKELEPIISIITKALHHGAYTELTELYSEGYQKYRSNKILSLLNDEELSFIRSNPVIPLASQYLSYPISFYNPAKKTWEGIAFDIVNEIALLSGLEFEINHPPSLTSVECLELMKSGKVYFMPYLIKSNEQLSPDSIYLNVLWSENPYMSDKYALLSKQNFPNINLNDISFARVGYPAKTAFAEMFQKWFPDALHAVEYPNTDETFAAVERGEIDLVMINRGRLAAMTNYYELSDYKANFVFDVPFYIHFGFNEEQTVLRSIVDKALSLINSDIIVDQWMSRTYNFEAMRLRSQRPWLIGAVTVSFLGLIILMFALVNNNRKRRTISKLLKKTKHVSEYELIKHVLPIRAMNVALWDVEIITDDINDNESFIRNSKFSWSQEFRQILGFTDETDFPNTFESWVEKIHPEDTERVINHAFAHLRDYSGKTHYDIEYRIKTKSGEYRYYHAIGMTQRDKNGMPLRLGGGLIDVHERTMMKQSLDRRDEMLRMLNETAIILLSHSNEDFDSIMNEGVKLIADTLNLHSLSVFRNNQKPDGLYASQIYNWDKKSGGICKLSDELQDVSYNDFTPYWGSLFIKGQPVNGPVSAMPPREAGIMQKFGVKSMYGAPVYINNELWGFVNFKDHENELVFDDISTEIMRSAAFLCVNAILHAESSNVFREQSVKLALSEKERELAQKYLAEIESARNAAEAASIAKSTFLANMSHEIRTPMNSIIGFSELAADENLPPKTKDYLNKISQSAELLLTIINDILDISKIESGKMELEYVPFELHEIFEYCRTAIYPKIAEKGLIFYCYAEPSIGKKLMGDPVRLRQVLINILSNSVKFTNAGSIKLLASIKNITDSNITVHFEVKDSGIGISDEQMAIIFKPFMQADSSITRKYGGTGLGLTITKNIIEMMDGTLQVESAPGVGSKFSFELTFNTIDYADDVIPRQNLPNVPKPEFEGDVLVCEDNVMNQQVICDHLTRVGLTTIIAENGRIGVDLVKSRIANGEKPFDLIFMDIHMPVMDGIEAAKLIIDLGCKTPIITLTANIMSGELEHYKAIGMTDSLGKPFTSADLWILLKRYLQLQ